MYLVDTNVFLEIFLRRQNSSITKRFLRETPFSHIYVTDLSIYTIGTIMFKHGLHSAYKQFISDLFSGGEVWRIQLIEDNTQSIAETAEKYALNFHDAYQYVAAQLYNLTMVSYNEAFDATERGRKVPADLLEE